MGRISMDFVIIFIIIISCEGIAGDSGYANLEYFQTIFFINQKTLAPSVLANVSCDQLNVSRIGDFVEVLPPNKCKGYVDQCDEEAREGENDMEYCMDAEGNRITFATVKRDHSSVQVYGKKPDDCKPTKLSGTNLDPAVSLRTRVCVCNCIRTVDWAPKEELWKFSLVPQISDEKIVTGVRFKVIDKTIHLEIKESPVDGNERGIWKNATENFDEVEPENAEKYFILSNAAHSLQLGMVHADPDHAITGVKFINVSKPNHKSELRLQVQIKKINLEDNSLDSETKWISFDSPNQNFDKWWPEHIFSDPSAVIKVDFKAKSLGDDLGAETTPVISTRNVESCTRTDHPLKGLQLLVGHVNDGKVALLFRIAPIFHKKNGREEEESGEGDSGNTPDAASTLSLQFALIVMLPLALIFNFFN